MYNYPMNGNQKRALIILLTIGLLWTLAMIPANLTGSQTPEMLQIFEVDEYAQYPHVIRMLTPGDTPYQSLRNFVVYLHYYYGYPFYFWSAIALLPVKLLGHLGDTPVTLCVLRTALSVLPMMISALILTWIADRFRRPLLSLLLFSFYLTMPAVLQNNFWWHPDSLTLLFLSLVFLFLDLDRLRLGKHFYLAAFACGAAIGTKYLGLYFALSIPVYLLFARRNRQMDLSALIKKAGLFLLIMAAAILISNPLLLLPQERAEILRIMEQQQVLSGTGVFTAYQNTFLENGRLPRYITENYALTFLFILAILGILIGIICEKENKEKQALTCVLAAYLLVALTVNFSAAAQRLHYFLPIFLPLFTALPNIIRPRFSKPLSLLLGLTLAIQIGIHIYRDVPLYQTQLNREADSPAIQIYETFAKDYLPLQTVSMERMTRVFRDWKIYFPETIGYAVETDWDMATQQRMDQWHPDLIFLERANIDAFSSDEALTQAVNPARMKAIHDFYLSAKEDRIPGFTKIYEDSFALIFMDNSLR